MAGDRPKCQPTLDLRGDEKNATDGGVNIKGREMPKSMACNAAPTY
jgi:hypothetical protein